MIELPDLRRLAAEGKIPVSLNIENLSNMEANGKRNGPISKVIISIVGSNGKERVVSIEPTIATTDLLDQASFEEIMNSPQFSDAVRKKIIRILSDEEARTINRSEKAIKNLENRAKTRGLVVETPVADGVGPITKMVTDFNADIIEEDEIVERLKDDAITFSKSDLTNALILVTDPTSDLYIALTEKLSDFEVS
jgi:hypothetical protein